MHLRRDRARYGGVDVMVSNAGISSFGSLATLPTAAWDRSFAVNACDHLRYLSRARRCGSRRRRASAGRSIFNATRNVTAPGKEFGAYSVSKAAEAPLCRIVALEGGEFGIRAKMLNLRRDGRRLALLERRNALHAQAYGIDQGKLFATSTGTERC